VSTFPELYRGKDAHNVVDTGLHE